MFFTFNDLSAQKNCFQTEAEAKSEIEKLVGFCKHLSSNSAVDEMFFPDTLFSIIFYSNYTIAEWLHDPAVSKNKRQYMLRFLDKHRRFYSNNDIDGEFRVCIDKQEYDSVGCAFALEHNHTLLSLPTNTMWESVSACGKYIWMNEDGEVFTDDRCIDNVWVGMPAEQFAEMQRERVYAEISSGQDLWEKREKLYPNLVFCENVKMQLFDDSEKYHIAAVMKKLDRFQEYFSCCGDVYNPNELGMNARTESETVKKHPAYLEERKIRLPNGSYEYFFDHVGFTGKYSGGRIYFLPDNSNNRCYIGYIGEHLSTKKY